MFEDFKVIHAYTRKQAIEDGVLVDVSDAKDSNGKKISPFKYPVAMTSAAYAAYAECVEAGGAWENVPGTNEQVLKLPGCQDVAGRLWDVFWMAICATRAAKGPTSEVHFSVSVLVDGENKRRIVNLWSKCGPGDNMEPTITIMKEGED